MSAAITLPQGVELLHLPAALPLVRGGSLAGAVLAYERQGPADAPTIAVLGGISAGRHVSAHADAPARGWWQDVVGPGCAIDTRMWQVLAFDWLGGAGASTAPASGEAFPFIDAADQARALLLLADALRIDHFEAVVGCSYGGMVAMHTAALDPRRVARLAVLAAAHRSDAQASAWRWVQRAVVQLGVRCGEPSSALSLARALAMTTYRTPLELRERFALGPDTIGRGRQAPVVDWLLAHGATFARQWSAEQFLCLSESVDAHTIDPAQIQVPTSLLAFGGDQLVPWRDMQEFADRLPALRCFREVASRFGHDGFLKEQTHVAAFLAEVLS